MLTIYAKNEQDTLTDAQKRAIRAVIEESDRKPPPLTSSE
jgi:hypothetical protein